jgi:hypothetical protein
MWEKDDGVTRQRRSSCFCARSPRRCWPEWKEEKGGYTVASKADH